MSTKMKNWKLTEYEPSAKIWKTEQVPSDSVHLTIEINAENPDLDREKSSASKEDHQDTQSNLEVECSTSDQYDTKIQGVPLEQENQEIKGKELPVDEKKESLATTTPEDLAQLSDVKPDVSTTAVPIFKIRRGPADPLVVKTQTMLKGRAENATLYRSSHIIPLFLNDIVQDVLHILHNSNNDSPIKNCCIRSSMPKNSRRCHIAIFNGNISSPEHFRETTDKHAFITKSYWQPLAFYNAREYFRTEISAIASVVANSGNIKNVKENHMSWEYGFKRLNLIPGQMANVFPINKNQMNEEKLDKPCKKAGLLMSITDMAEAKISLPIEPKGSKSYLTKQSYEFPTEDSLLVCFDTENINVPMRMIAIKETANDNEDKIVIDALIQDPGKNRNEEIFTARFPNLKKNPETAKLLDEVKYSVEAVRKEFVEKIPDDSILVVHDGSSDFRCMEMSHPWIINSSDHYTSEDYPRKKKPSLKELAEIHLDRLIQEDAFKHDSREDSEATLDLVLLKLKHDIFYKNQKYMDTIKKVSPASSTTFEGRVAIVSSEEESKYWALEIETLVLKADGDLSRAHNNIQYISSKSITETVDQIKVSSKDNQLMISCFNIRHLNPRDCYTEIGNITESIMPLLQENTLLIVLLIDRNEIQNVALSCIKK